MEEDLSSFATFCRIVAQLRAPDGCPWDRQQTHESLKSCLTEEAYEVLQVIDDGDGSGLCEELGDVLLQIGLHAQIASEAGQFQMADVLRGINEKLIRRHPHVFAGSSVASAEAAVSQWEELKRGEKEERKSLLDGIPRDIPALAYSQMLQQRAARVGFDWKEFQGVLDKVNEELGEIREARSHQQRVAEFGDLLFSLANTARWLGIDLEGALRQANERFSRRFARMEELSQRRGISLDQLSLEELDALWDEAKRSYQGDESAESPQPASAHGHAADGDGPLFGRAP